MDNYIYLRRSWFPKWKNPLKSIEKIVKSHLYMTWSHTEWCSLASLKKYTTLKHGYLIRYVDDWVIITNSKNNAYRWKTAISRFLKERPKLELSKEKTRIINVRKEERANRRISNKMQT
ncbi:hypothetical protein [Seinonella peptonophila]|nr:hypothetical protein [Seinonella peptonophila]